jgi:hypothetical protein
MDDIQDVFVEAQIAAMNLLISKDQPLSLGLIMNEIGNDLYKAIQSYLKQSKNQRYEAQMKK